MDKYKWKGEIQLYSCNKYVLSHRRWALGNSSRSSQEVYNLREADKRRSSRECVVTEQGVRLLQEGCPPPMWEGRGCQSMFPHGNTQTVLQDKQALIR